MHAMHGHGYGQAPSPQRPSSAAPVMLRIVFVAVAVLSCGMLSWVALLRIAILTRTVRDWLLFAASCVATITALWLIGEEPSEALDSVQENVGLILLLATAIAVIAYYLYADIRFEQRRQQAYFSGPIPPAAPAYGYPQQHIPPHLRETYVPGSHTAPPQQPAPARIDQVRAELDELSSMLRKQDDTGTDTAPGDGRR